MNKLQRTIFFWSLVLLFLITAPAVVLRARGYRFDLSRGVFVYSGSINIKSNPQDINVTLNGKLSESKKLDRINNSFNISGLLPGDYDIKIEAPGFQSWEKEAQVHSGLANEFWNVLLIRDSYEKTRFQVPAARRFFISPNNKLAATYGQEGQNLALGIIDISNDSLQKSFVFEDRSPISEDIDENAEWSPVRNNLISIPSLMKKEESSQEDGLEYFIADLSRDRQFSLNGFLGIKDIRGLRWDPKDENFVFFLDGEDLLRANITDDADVTTIASDVSSFDLSQNSVFYVQRSNKIVYRKSLDGKSDKQQLTYAFPDGGPADINKLIVYDEDRIAFLDSDRDLFVFNRGEQDTYFKKLGSRIVGIHFSNDGKKILFWTNNEISVYFARNWDVQPIRKENEVKNITRYIESIRNVQWFDDYEHIIFNVGNYAKIIELDSRDQRNCMDLLRTDSMSPSIVYDSSLEKLFFTDEENGKWGLYSIDFPEPTTILGF